MQVFTFLAVVISLSCGSWPPSDVEAGRAFVATVGLVSGWILLCHVGARAIAVQVRDQQLDAVVAAGWLDKQLDAFRWLGLGVAVLCLGGFGVAQAIDELPWLNESMFLQALVLLSPITAMMVGTWSAEHRYGVLLGYTDQGFRNHVRSVGLALRSALAWLVAPILILLLAGDLLAKLPIDSTSAAWISVLVLAIFVPLILPWLIRYLFKTKPLSEPTQQWVTQLMSAAGLRRTRSMRWDTGGRSFNAMVAGFLPPMRTLLISDRLLDELPREQVAMVVLHEAAHLRRRHVPLRMLSVLPAWAAGAAVTRVAGDANWAVLLGSGIGILLTMWLLRVVAFRTEFDADVVACRMAESITGLDDVPTTYESAAEALSLALMRVTRDCPATRKATWLHPGVAARVDWMRRHRAAPQSTSTSAGTIANPA